MTSALGRAANEGTDAEGDLGCLQGQRLQKIPIQPTPWSWTCGLQNCEEAHDCGISHFARVAVAVLTQALPSCPVCSPESRLPPGFSACHDACRFPENSSDFGQHLRLLPGPNVLSAWETLVTGGSASRPQLDSFLQMHLPVPSSCVRLQPDTRQLPLPPWAVVVCELPSGPLICTATCPGC